MCRLSEMFVGRFVQVTLMRYSVSDIQTFFVKPVKDV